MQQNIDFRCKNVDENSVTVIINDYPAELEITYDHYGNFRWINFAGQEYEDTENTSHVFALIDGKHFTLDQIIDDGMWHVDGFIREARIECAAPNPAILTRSQLGVR